jgi:hypothetical protein
VSATVTNPVPAQRSAAQRSAAWSWSNDLRPRAWTVVRVALGLLLVTAAALKLYGLNVTAIPRAGWFATPQVQVIAAEWELILGFWLLSGVYRFAAWFFALLTFTTFAVISAYFGFIGIASCGCFGVIRTSPWTVFAIDLAAIVTLLVFRPQRTSHAPREDSVTRSVTTTMRSHASIPLTAVAILIALTAVGSFVYGSPAAALAKLRGESLTVEPSYVDFGDGKPGDVLEATVTVYNWTDQPVRLIGGTTDCSFLSYSDLPLNIEPHFEGSMRLVLRVPDKRGQLTRRAALLTELATARKLPLTVTVRAIPE